MEKRLQRTHRVIHFKILLENVNALHVRKRVDSNVVEMACLKLLNANLDFQCKNHHSLTLICV